MNTEQRSGGTAGRRTYLAEFAGTAVLVAAVIGSAISAERLTPDPALQLLVNALVTGAALAVLIATLGPVSGAHFNPVVTAGAWLLERRSGRPASARAAAGYVAAQVAGGLTGAMLAHAMYDQRVLQVSETARATAPHALAEVVATSGLVVVIFGLLRARGADRIPWAVGAYIGAAYWFTSSTSFANPAVTLARAFTGSGPGIAPASVPLFVAAQVVGLAVALVLVHALYPEPRGARRGRADVGDLP